MAVREILRMGTPSLFQPSKAVHKREFDSPQLHALLADMLDTMRAANGAGLAAPQIGENVRVVVFEVVGNTRYPEAEDVPLTVLINPVLTPIGNAMEEGFEGCLSVPGLRGEVPRYAKLRYQGFDAQGAAIDRTVEGFHARVVQHECDHLDGILYPSRITDMQKFGYTEVLFPNMANAADD
jgi:peptide deformylase